MSEQLEPELERVARMLAAAGPLPDAPATLRERALRIPDGGSAPDRRARRPNRRLPPSRSHAAGSAGRDRSRWRVSRLPWWRSPSSRRLRSCATTAATASTASTSHRVRSPRRAAAPRTSSGTVTAPPRSSSRSGRCRARATVAPTRRGSGARATAGRWGRSAPDTTGKATITFRVSAQGREQVPLAVGHERAPGGSAKPSEDTALWGPLT